MTKRIGLLIQVLLLLMQSNHAAGGDKEVTFSITPRYCVVQDVQHVCVAQMTIVWAMPTSATSAEPVCVKENNRTLQCWEGVSTGQLQHKAEVQLPAIYSLTHKNTGELIVSSELELQTVRSSRRRLRSVWSFF
ncbi:DUF3019 domain-containing protein [Pseudoalteromonas sp. SSDWG2]|uniref:DUF3019 domain-containing protein n=1 Tax=Pseudoalteromonas sp. SSDWG2 TaxID=3139391 RepID=UPI003BAB398C